MIYIIDNILKFIFIIVVDGFLFDSDGNFIDVVLFSILGDISLIYVGGVFGGID